MRTRSTFIDALRTILDPGEGDKDYGWDGRRPEWLDVDWRSHLHRVEVAGREVELVDLGSGPETILWVHGLGAAWQCWLENLPHFARTHRVVAFDLPGFGRSDMPRDEISIERYAHVLDELCERLGIERAIVVGNSMGGFIGAELAIRFPHRVDRLVLVAAAVLWQEYRRARPLLALAETTEAAVARLVAEPGPLLLKRPRLRAVGLALGGIRYPHRLSREFQIELISSAKRTDGFVPALRALATYPLREELERIACPTLIVWGAHDPLVSVGHARELESSIPDARTVIMERTGHTPMLERPARFNRLLERWLASGEVEETSPEARESAFSR